ncbi:MAG: hypothetical protein V3T86_04330 [Planctomycetota bacterium]
MSDFVILLGAAVGAAYGTWAAGKSETRLGWKIAAICCFAFAGLAMVAQASLGAAGEILPGHQLHPETLRDAAAHIHFGDLHAPAPAFALLALLGHAFLWMSRPSRLSAVLPFPAAAVFVCLFLVTRTRGGEDPIEYIYADGPEIQAVLTVIPEGDDVRLLVGIGDWNDTFLKVVHKHKAGGRPKKPSLRWTKDGKAIVVRFLRERLLLIDLDGETIGRLPRKANEWPRETSIAVSPATIKWRQEARKNVNIAVKAHGGIFIQ